MRIIVLGAGIIGIMSAYYLNRIGCEVTVIDKNSESALETSYMNGGQLSYAHAEPFANINLLKQIVKLLLREDSTIKVNRNFTHWKWLYTFLLNAFDTKAIANLKRILSLSYYSRELLHELIMLHDLEFDHQKTGNIHIVSNSDAYNMNHRWLQIKQELQCEMQILSKQQCIALEPALAHYTELQDGSIFFPNDEAGDTLRFAKQIEQICIKEGVKFLYDTEINNIVTGSDKLVTELHSSFGEIFTANCYLMTMGAYQNNKLRNNTCPIKGYSIDIKFDDPKASSIPNIPLLFNDKRIVISRLNNNLRVAGMMDLFGYDYNIYQHRIDRLLQELMKIFPALANLKYEVQTWSCLRNFTPNNIPMIGKTKYKNLFLNTGHSNLGWTTACASSKLVAYIIKNNVLPKQVEHNKYIREIARL